MIQADMAYFADLGSKAILWILFIASFFVLAATIERLWFYRRNFLSESEQLIKELLTLPLSDVMSKLKTISAVETRLIVDAFTVTDHDTGERFVAAVSASIGSKKPSWERFFLLFSAVGSNAPFLGLLGTVLGLMQSFTDLALSAKPDAAVAMAGISNALITTVAGIVLAIPSLIVLNYLKMRESMAIETVGSLTDVVISLNKTEEKK